MVGCTRWNGMKPFPTMNRGSREPNNSHKVGLAGKWGHEHWEGRCKRKEKSVTAIVGGARQPGTEGVGCHQQRPACLERTTAGRAALCCSSFRLVNLLSQRLQVRCMIHRYRTWHLGLLGWCPMRFSCHDCIGWARMNVPYTLAHSRGERCQIPKADFTFKPSSGRDAPPPPVERI